MSELYMCYIGCVFHTNVNCKLEVVVIGLHLPGAKHVFLFDLKEMFEWDEKHLLLICQFQ